MASLLDCPRGFKHKMEAWLWRHGFHNALIRVVALVQLLGVLALLSVGIFSFLFSEWLLWFGVGFAMHAVNFFFLAKQILGMDLNAYRSAMLVVLLCSSGLRLLVTALVLYFVLIACSAPVSAIMGGFITAVLAALGTFAIVHFNPGGK